MITKTLKEKLAQSLNGVSFTEPTYLAWGIGETEPTANDTSLEAEVERNIKTESLTIGTVFEISSTMNTLQGNGELITEIGLFNNDTNGDMFAREVVHAIEKTNSFEIESTFTISIL